MSSEKPPAFLSRASLSFEALETLEKKQTQTDREFSGDVAALLELWAERRKEEIKGD